MSHIDVREGFIDLEVLKWCVVDLLKNLETYTTSYLNCIK
jgi:hypothetical protein